MKPKNITHASARILAGPIAMLLGSSGAHAVDYNFGSTLSNFTLTATDQARGLGTGATAGIGFNDNTFGSVYDRGAARDATYMHFNLSSLAGATISGMVNLNLTIDATYGGAINGGVVGSATNAWSYPGTTGGITTISGANPSGTYTSGQTATAVIDNATFQGFVTNPGTFKGLAITAGAGSTAHFSAPATLTGSTIVSAITVTGATDWSAAVFNSGTLSISGASDVSGGSVTVLSGATVSVTGSATLGAGSFSGGFSSGGTLSFGSSASQTLSGVISGSGALAKGGAGTLALSGANTYTGATTISAGSLQLGNGGTTGSLSASSAITNNGNLTINRSNAATQGADFSAAAITGNGSFTQAGAGTTTLTAANTYTGATTINGGGLILTSSGLIAAASNIQVNSGTLTIAEGGGGRTLANNMVLNGGVVQGLLDNAGTGGTITFSGGNVTHTFTASGSLVLPTSVVSASELIVGAGGGGGAGVSFNVYNAGGGGGQVLNLTGQTLAAGSTSVVVGAGGAGGNNVSGTSGGASSIGGNTAAGGSGANDNNGTGGTSGSGMAGGVRNSSASGGGGGASAAGATAPNGSAGGNGGAGSVGTITGSFYGGGGGGSSNGTQGAGGVGGGGSGSGSNVGTTGTVNTGGGGGSGAAGGSGIAIVQYAYATVAGTVTLSGTIDLQSASTLDAYGTGGLLDVTGSISTSMGSGGLTIASSNSSGGVVRFGSTNTYLGNTTVNSGATLQINGANNGLGSVNVNSGATLGGTGSIAGAVNVTGVLSPGASIQSLASGALTMTAGSTFGYEAANNTATGADLMVVNGALSLTGATLDLSAANLALGTWVAGDKLTLISYTGAAITSGFTGYTDDTTYTGGIFGLNQWVFNYNDSTAGANYNGEATGSSFVTLTAVPEPDVTMLVGGLGLVALLRRRRA